MTANPFKPAKAVKFKRGKSTRALAKDAAQALVRRTAKPGLRGYILKLPPLSLNNVYQNRGDGGRRVGPAYKRWLAEAGWEIRLQKPEPVAGPFCAFIEVGTKISRADLDNLAKPIIDLMVAQGCVPDDRNMRLLLLERTERVDVAVTVWTEGIATLAQVRARDNAFATEAVQDVTGVAV